MLRRSATALAKVVFPDPVVPTIKIRRPLLQKLSGISLHFPIILLHHSGKTRIDRLHLEVTANSAYSGGYSDRGTNDRLFLRISVEDLLIVGTGLGDRSVIQLSSVLFGIRGKS